MSLVGVMCCLVTTRGSAQEQAWEFTPYKVQIWLATSASGELDEHVRQSLSDSLLQQIDSMIGAPWHAEIVQPPADFAASMLISDDLVTPEAIVESAPEAYENDKVILLTVRANPRDFQIVAKELDCRTRMFGAPVRYTIRQPANLARTCFDAVAKSFRAITRLEVGVAKAATVRIRAGGLVLKQSSPCYVGIDDVLHPIQRNNDREGQPKLIVPIEWTFLLVQRPDETNPYLMTCRVWSGKPNPVTGRISARKERYALKVKPVTKTTTVQVLSRVLRRGDEPYPMPGLEVYAKAPVSDPPKEPAPPAEEPAPEPDAEPADDGSTDGGDEKDDSKGKKKDKKKKGDDKPAPPKKPAAPKVQGDPAELIGRTDWNGTLEVGQSDTPLRILYLKNGAQLLARLPMVPGLDPKLIASVPDDAPRLQAEGFIKGIQGQLMDLEAQREILKARFMLRIEELPGLKGDELADKLKEAQTLLEEIKQLPNRNSLTRQLDIQQTQQLTSPVKSVQARIDQLYAKMREALGKYLSPNLVNELTRVLNDARQNPTAAATSNRVE